MGMFDRLMESGVYDDRCKMLQEHWAGILNVPVDDITVEVTTRIYSKERITFFNISNKGEFVISERYANLISMKSYREKMQKRHDEMRKIKKERFELVTAKFKANGITKVTFDEESAHGAIAYVCDKCGYVGHTNLSSAIAGKCRCRQCWLNGKRI